MTPEDKVASLMEHNWEHAEVFDEEAERTNKYGDAEETTDEEEVEVEGEEKEVEDEDVDPAVKELRDQVEALKRESEGRLRALLAERQNRGEIGELRNLVFELKAARDEEGDEAFPDPEEDPVGYLEAVNTEEALELREQIEQLTQAVQTQQFNEQVNRLAYIADRQEADFAKEHTDYAIAYNFVKDQYFNQLINSGYTKAQADAELAKLSLQVAAEAAAGGPNVAERIYTEALRWGYKPPTVKAKATTPPKRRETTSLSSVNGASSSPTQSKGIVDRKWLQDNLTQAQRVQLFQKHPRVFRDLDEHGRARLPKEYWEELD